MSDAIGDLFRSSIKKFAFDVAKAKDAALRAAWTKNECPQCHSGVHPEAMVVIDPWTPATFDSQSQTITKTFLVCCIRCVNIITEAQQSISP